VHPLRCECHAARGYGIIELSELASRFTGFKQSYLPRITLSDHLQAPLKHSSLPDDFRDTLHSTGFEGDIRTDTASRLLYSTDASIYQVEPLGVVIPSSQDDLALAVEVCSQNQIPILARGSGSSLAGQAVGQAVILDCSKHLNRLIELDPEQQTATVEPGYILSNLNRAAAGYGLQFGPDPASADRASMGGSIANNASGSHSILYGMAADHILAADVLLADGTQARFQAEQVKQLEKSLPGMERNNPTLANIYRTALRIRQENIPLLKKRWPKTWRRASGYSLNYLVPFSPSAPPRWYGTAEARPYPPLAPGDLNLATLLAGSEGTLAVIQNLKVRLVALPKHTILAVLAYASIAEACEAVPEILDRQPTAVELIPQSLIELARSIPAYASQVSFVQGNPAALLVVEFSGENPEFLIEQARNLRADVLLAVTAKQQQQVWSVRKVGLGLLQARHGEPKPIGFIEDLAVPVEKLGLFIRSMDQILADHSTTGEIYAHASAGCLHIRPILNIKDRQGVEAMRSIANQAVALTIRLGGSVSGEHGDGLARSEWMQDLYGPEILQLFREVKEAADPNYLLNPGKIVWPEGSSPPRMDVNLRYGEGYQAVPWTSVLDFSTKAGLDGAIEQCNGAGVCRKSDGVMCPSFQVTGEEMHSTRGRANLLRAMISGQFPDRETAERTVYEAIDLCLACKGCQAECPSNVDVAKLRYEFLQYYYSDQASTRHYRRLRDYLFGYIDRMARLGYRFAPLINGLTQSTVVRQLGARVLGLAAERPFPELNRHALRDQVRVSGRQDSGERVLFLTDAFTEYFQPEVGVSAIRVLERCGCSVEILPVTGAGRTLISKGFLSAAKKHATQVLDAIRQIDPQGSLPIVGVEPSEIYTLRDEYLDLLPGEATLRLAGRSFMFDEFLLRPGPDGRPRLEHLLATQQKTNEPRQLLGKVLLHTHCYQKAQPPASDGFPSGADAALTMLIRAGFEVEQIDSGCCGMAGGFGYEDEHYAISRQIGELKLLPAVRSAPEDTIIVAAGVSCEAQIKDNTTRKPVHPAILLDQYFQPE
jgi:FAD/FMN-containing dehydrogenase/Fe-S oxidoreductase